MAELKEDPAVTNFRKYLRINTVQPNPNYAEASSYFKSLAAELELPYKTVQVVSGKDMCIITWTGQQPNLSSVLLYSHIDVVPVFPEHWRVDPFSAEKIDGNIYARGSQDMKCVGIQYIEAIRRLKKEGRKFQRTIHIMFGPDEEIGGMGGMGTFYKMDEFKQLNIGFALDEGIANPEEAFRVFYGERNCWWCTVICPGDPGHGSAILKNTAAEKFNKVINSFLSFRREQEERLESNPNLTLGDVTTVNLTMVEGGVQMNVIPAEMKASFDIRIPPTVNLEEFEKKINMWCKEAGEGIRIVYPVRGMSQDITSISSEDKWWAAFSSACSNQNMKIQTEIFPAATDSRFVRSCGIPAIGFSPMNYTPILLHDHNEYLNEDIFLRGIEIYQEIIPALANVQ
ncbi:hypothetical protein SNE40_013488 [Patella caerulea]|uniref:N-acyl-aliphatic-L-amino acid amidohydrolase n=1 Tax=Patella caerulea TaxID=87958 RepID=A0AAN8JBP7_PATCE